MRQPVDPRPAVGVVRRYLDAWLAGDVMTVLSLYHEELTLHWPGTYELAGTHAGQQAAIEALLALQEATNREPLEIVDVLDGDHGVAAIVVEQWSRDDPAEVLEHTRVLHFTVHEDKLHSCRVFESAQAEIDAWLIDLTP